MTPETIAILGVGIALAGMILHTNRETNRAIGGLRSEVADVRDGMTDLRERMARLEGLFEGFTRCKPPEADRAGVLTQAPVSPIIGAP